MSLNGDLAHPFEVGVEELVIEPTAEISERDLSSLLRRPDTRYIKNGTSKPVIQNDSGAIPTSVVTVCDPEDFRIDKNFREQFRFIRVVDEPRAHSNRADYDDRAQFPRHPRLRALVDQWSRFAALLLSLRQNRDFWRQGRLNRNRDHGIAIWARCSHANLGARCGEVLPTS